MIPPDSRLHNPWLHRLLVQKPLQRLTLRAESEKNVQKVDSVADTVPAASGLGAADNSRRRRRLRIPPSTFPQGQGAHRFSEQGKWWDLAGKAGKMPISRQKDGERDGRRVAEQFLWFRVGNGKIAVSRPAFDDSALWKWWECKCALLIISKFSLSPRPRRHHPLPYHASRRLSLSTPSIPASWSRWYVSYHLAPLSIITLSVRKVILPTLDYLSNPNEIFQLIIWLLSEVEPKPDDFVACLTNSTCIEELEAVYQSIIEEKTVMRGKDSGGEQGDFLKKESETKIFFQFLSFIKIIFKEKLFFSGFQYHW